MNVFNFKGSKNDSFDRISDHIKLNCSLPRYRFLIYRKPDSSIQRVVIIPFDARSSIEHDGVIFCPFGWLYQVGYDFDDLTVLLS